MNPKIVQRSERRLTDEERSRLDEIFQLVESEKEDIVRRGREILAEEAAAEETLRDAMQQLRAERLSVGVSLQEVGARAGLAEPLLSRLESDPHAHPTLAVVTRYAQALGRKLVISLVPGDQA